LQEVLGIRKKTIKSPMRKVDQIEDSSTSMKTGACRPTKTEKPLKTDLKQNSSIDYVFYETQWH